jgi:hypothetical protein
MELLALLIGVTVVKEVASILVTVALVALVLSSFDKHFLVENYLQQRRVHRQLT